jgi:ornithine cyclodeaminase/alanine dehydrogenase-like protein (mu-crystallin family)
MADAIAAVRDAFIGAARGEFQTVPRVVLPSHTLFTMVAERIRDGRNLGQVVKTFSYHEDNPPRGFPVLQGIVVWLDGLTGEPQAVIDAAEVTALRTGAAAGVATDLLAVPDARALAIIGAGALAPDQARAVCAVRPIERIAIAARDFARTKTVASSLQTELGVRATAYETAAEAVRDADVICTATTAREPLFCLADVKPNAHINAMGAFNAQMREIGTDVVAAAFVCIDDPAAMTACGELAGMASQPPLLERLLAEDRRQNPIGKTVFKSIGISPQDWAIAALVVRSGDNNRVRNGAAPDG